VLAAFGLASLRRSRENLLDWFALSVFTVALLTVWLYWLAALTGMAPKMAKSVYMLAPGLDVTLDWSILAPLTVTVIWFVFVIWRLTHRPIVVWRGPWLSAAGMTAVAVTLLGLWHEGIDVNRSYQGVARATAEAIESLAGTGTKIDGADLPRRHPRCTPLLRRHRLRSPGRKGPLEARTRTQRLRAGEGFDRSDLPPPYRRNVLPCCGHDSMNPADAIPQQPNTKSRGL